MIEEGYEGDGWGQLKRARAVPLLNLWRGPAGPHRFGNLLYREVRILANFD